jgi:Ser/Thr protein kinase RdoA (MazF antagonist)
MSDVQPLLHRSLDRWGLPATSRLTLVNHSENHTVRVDGPDGSRHALRVHRPGYQSAGSIASELAWLAALSGEGDLTLPTPIAGRDGHLLQSVDSDGEARHAVLFAFLEGREPTPDDDLETLFEALGGIAARLHRHAEAWQRPPGFERQRWDAETILDADGLWGNWRIAPGVDDAVRPTLDALDTRLRADLIRYGTGAGRYGLIHADMRLGNLLVSPDRVALIDFDDCGFCWFAYDFAAAVSFHECELDLAALKARWLEGYLPVRALDQSDIEAMDTMVMLRRMALLAWIGTHAETDLAQRHMPGFAAGTADLARRYLG